MRKTFTVALIIDLCSILLCLFVFIQYVAYLENQNFGEAITLVTEELSINYLDGNLIKVDEATKNIQFSITNHSLDTKYYYIRLNELSGSFEHAIYTISSTNENYNSFDANFEQTILGNRIEILPNETHRYTMQIQNPDKKEFQFKIESDIEEIDNSFYNTILLNNNILEKNDESGLIRKAEQDGDVYYFRGNVSNNYVSFAGLTWRIVKINEDKTVKLVLNGITENMIMMNTNEQTGNMDFYSSNLNKQLESWYTINLLDYDSFISSTRYCLDDSVMTAENNQIEYLANVRIFSEQNPTNACNGTSISNKIAVLTADEVMFAGANLNENKDYYLYLDGLQSSWWTMTPYQKQDNKVYYVAVSNTGSLVKDVLETSNLFVRPVITLVKRAKVTGSGTMDDPYTLT